MKINLGKEKSTAGDQQVPVDVSNEGTDGMMYPSAYISDVSAEGLSLGDTVTLVGKIASITESKRVDQPRQCSVDIELHSLESSSTKAKTKGSDRKMNEEDELEKELSKSETKESSYDEDEESEE